MKKKPKKKTAVAKQTNRALAPIDMWGLSTPWPNPTKELAERLILHISKGATMKAAFTAEGIGVTQVREWRDKAESDPQSDAASLFRVLDAAEAELEIALTASIPGARHFHGSAWLLSRRFAARWGDKPLADTDTVRINVVRPQIDHDTGSRVLEVLQALGDQVIDTTATPVD